MNEREARYSQPKLELLDFIARYVTFDFTSLEFKSYR